MTPVIHEGLPTASPTSTPRRPANGVESFDELIEQRGRERARYVMLRLLERAREKQVGVPALRSTDYINTIPPEREPWFPGDEEIERRIRAFIRWKRGHGVRRQPQGARGRRPHRDVPVEARRCTRRGFDHFFRGKDHEGGGDQISSRATAPPAYARAFLEGPARPRSRFCGTSGRRYNRVGKGLPFVPAPPADAGSGSSRPSRWGSPRSTRYIRRRFYATLADRGIEDTSRAGTSGVPRRLWQNRRSPVAAGRDRPGGARGARRPDLRREFQPPAARRAGTRQRQEYIQELEYTWTFAAPARRDRQGRSAAASRTPCWPVTSTASSSTA